MNNIFEDMKDNKPMCKFLDNIFVGACKVKDKSDDNFVVLFGIGTMLHIITSVHLNQKDIDEEKDLQKLINNFARSVIEETGEDKIKMLLSHIYGQGATITVKMPRDLDDMFEEMKKDIPEDVKKSIDNIINFLDEKNKKR